jgi:hypothetical protein
VVANLSFMVGVPQFRLKGVVVMAQVCPRCGAVKGYEYYLIKMVIYVTGTIAVLGFLDYKLNLWDWIKTAWNYFFG